MLAGVGPGSCWPAAGCVLATACLDPSRVPPLQLPLMRACTLPGLPAGSTQLVPHCTLTCRHLRPSPARSPQPVVEIGVRGVFAIVLFFFLKKGRLIYFYLRGNQKVRKFSFIC